VLLQVGAGFRVGFGVMVLWGHDTMTLLVSAICVSFSCVVFLFFVVAVASLSSFACEGRFEGLGGFARKKHYR
jgi:hypothetical protein